MIRTKKRNKNGNVIEIKHQGGAIGHFKNDFIRQVFLLGMLGARDQDIAVFFDVHLTTIEGWKRTNKEFTEAMRMGKIHFDCKVVEQMGRRAIGYDYVETEVYERPGRDGKIWKTVKTFNKHMPPDVTAMIFWLKNRQRDIWTDVNKIENYNVNNYNIKNQQLNTMILTDEEKNVLRGAIIRQLGDGANGHSNEKQDNS